MIMKIKENQKAPSFNLYGTKNTEFDLKKFKEQEKTRRAPIIARVKITDFSNKNK